MFRNVCALFQLRLNGQSGQEIKVKDGWYAGIGSDGTTELPIGYDEITDGQVHSYEYLSVINTGDQGVFTRSAKKFSFSVKICREFKANILFSVVTFYLKCSL